MQPLPSFTISFDAMNQCDEVDDYIKVMRRLANYFDILDSDENENIEYIRNSSWLVIDALIYFPRHLNGCKVSDKTLMMKNNDDTLQFECPDILVPDLLVAEQDFRRVNELYVRLLNEFKSTNYLNWIDTPNDKETEALNLKPHVTKLLHIAEEMHDIMFGVYIKEDCFTVTDKCIHLQILNEYCKLRPTPHVVDYRFEVVIDSICKYLERGTINHKHIDDIVCWMINKFYMNESLDELKRLCDQDSYLRNIHNRSLKEGLYKYEHKICLLDEINLAMSKYEL